jgi:hypothetical protein
MKKDQLKRLKPYQNWEEKELRTKLIKDVANLNIDDTLVLLWANIIKEAFNDKSWNVIEDYNGCTAVQDYIHPCPACFVHDYMWITGHGGAMADRIFYYLMRAEGMPANKSKRRWFAVRFMWYVGYMWKYIITRNWEPPTNSMLALNKYFEENA